MDLQQYNINLETTDILQTQANIIMMSDSNLNGIATAKKYFPYPNYQQFMACLSIYLINTAMIGVEKIVILKEVWRSNFTTLAIDFITSHEGLPHYSVRRLTVLSYYIDRRFLFDPNTYDRLWNRYILYHEDSFKPFLIKFLTSGSNVVIKILTRLNNHLPQHVKAYNILVLANKIPIEQVSEYVVDRQNKIQLFLRVMEIVPLGPTHTKELLLSLLISRTSLTDELILFRLLLCGKLHHIFRLKDFPESLLSKLGGLIQKHSMKFGEKIIEGLSKFNDDVNDRTIIQQFINKCSLLDWIRKEDQLCSSFQIQAEN
jgi:hypothetical protein